MLSFATMPGKRFVMLSISMAYSLAFVFASLPEEVLSSKKDYPLFCSLTDNAKADVWKNHDIYYFTIFTAANQQNLRNESKIMGKHIKLDNKHHT